MSDERPKAAAITTKASNTETATSPMAETLTRLEEKIDRICKNLDARPTHDEMNTAITTRVDAAQENMQSLLNGRITAEQAQRIVNDTISKLVENVDKLATGLDAMRQMHNQAMQRMEKLYEVATANSAALTQMAQDVDALEESARERDQHIATMQAENTSDRQKLTSVWNTLMPSNGSGGLLAQTQIMAASISKTQDMLIAVEATTDELDKHRARQVRREERFRAFVQSKTGLATAAAVFGPLFGNWLGLVDLDSLGKAIGLAIKLLI